jgi:hypothetical protein
MMVSIKSLIFKKAHCQAKMAPDRLREGGRNARPIEWPQFFWPYHKGSARKAAKAF